MAVNPITGQEERDLINSDYAAARKGSSLSDTDWAKSSEFQGFEDRLISNGSSITDIGALDKEIAGHESRFNDPNHGASARRIAASLSARRTGLSAPPAAPAAPAAPGLPNLPAAQGQDSVLTDQPQMANDTVESRLPGLIASTSPLMEKARGEAMKTMNKRGLVNSSMAAGEGTKAGLGVAMEIAKQDASQTHQKNLAAQGFGYNTQLQGQQITGQKEIQDQQDASAMQRLLADGVNRVAIQAMADAAAKERQGLQLTSDEKISADRFNEAGLDRDSRDQNTADTIEMQRNTNIQNAVANANATYTSYVSSVNANSDIPATQRNALIRDASLRRDAELDLAEQIYSVDLTWDRTPDEVPQTPQTPTGFVQ